MQPIYTLLGHSEILQWDFTYAGAAHHDVFSAGPVHSEILQWDFTYSGAAHHDVFPAGPVHSQLAQHSVLGPETLDEETAPVIENQPGRLSKILVTWFRNKVL